MRGQVTVERPGSLVAYETGGVQAGGNALFNEPEGRNHLMGKRCPDFPDHPGEGEAMYECHCFLHYAAPVRQMPAIGQFRHFSWSFPSHPSDIPRWQMEKSYLTGSAGSSARSFAVISRAMRQSACFRVVKPSSPQILWMCASTGITSFAGEMPVQSPRSMPSSGRTIHLRYMQSLLQALPEAGEGKKKGEVGVCRDRGGAEDRGKVEGLHRGGEAGERFGDVLSSLVVKAEQPALD